MKKIGGLSNFSQYPGFGFLLVIRIPFLVYAIALLVSFIISCVVVSLLSISSIVLNHPVSISVYQSFSFVLLLA